MDELDSSAFVSDADVALMVSKFLSRNGCVRARSSFMKEAKHLFTVKGDSSNTSMALSKYQGLKDLINACLSKPAPQQVKPRSSLSQRLVDLIDDTLIDIPADKEQLIVDSVNNILKIASLMRNTNEIPQIHSNPTNIPKVPISPQRPPNPTQITDFSVQDDPISILRSPHPDPSQISWAPSRPIRSFHPEHSHLLSFPSHSVDPFRPADSAADTKEKKDKSEVLLQLTASDVVKENATPVADDVKVKKQRKRKETSFEASALQKKGSKLLDKNPEELLAKLKKVKRKHNI